MSFRTSRPPSSRDRRTPFPVNAWCDARRSWTQICLLREHLNPITASLTDIHESIRRNVHAVQRGHKFFQVSRQRAGLPIIGWHRVVTDFAQRHPMTAPAALEDPRIHVVHHHALLIYEVQLVSVLVQIEKFYGHDDVIGVLIILGYRPCVLPRWFFRVPVAEFPQKLSIAGKFLNAVVTGVSSEPHVAFPVYHNGMFGASSRFRYSFGRPAGHIVRTTPGFQQVTGGIKFQNRWRRYAAIGAWRRCSC